MSRWTKLVILALTLATPVVAWAGTATAALGCHCPICGGCGQ